MRVTRKPHFQSSCRIFISMPQQQPEPRRESGTVAGRASRLCSEVGSCFALMAGPGPRFKGLGRGLSGATPLATDSRGSGLQLIKNFLSLVLEVE